MTTDTTTTTTTANKVIVVGMLDTMLIRDRDARHDKERRRRAGRGLYRQGNRVRLVGRLDCRMERQGGHRSWRSWPRSMGSGRLVAATKEDGAPPGDTRAGFDDHAARALGIKRLKRVADGIRTST
jgi:hypothetical protein